MRETVRLEVGALSAEVVPSIGGGVARFDLQRGGETIEIFRPWPEGGSGDPNTLGLYVLAPWSNRISGGGFTFNGDFHALAPNITGEPHPIHGDAWQEPWPLVSHDERHVRMVRDAHGPGPFRYRAQIDYGMFSYGMSARMLIINTGRIPLPFGAGFHPWLPRTAGTRLSAPAKTVWLADEEHLPTERIPAHDRPEWDFNQPRALPAGWINNGFTGWNRKATVFWDDRDLALDILASHPIDTYILFSPSSESTFFCFEPVTHAINAHNLAPGPEAHGLAILDPGEGLVAECRFRVRSGPTTE
jgi:aldose 1-epimerase